MMEGITRVIGCATAGLAPLILMSVLVADIGGTHIKLGIVRQGVVVARDAIPAAAVQGFAAALERVEVGWRPLLCTVEGGLAAINGIGIAFPGLIHPQTGRILSSPVGKFDDARALDLDDWARRKFALPLTVSNDANAALTGEWHYGAARGCRSVVMVTLGTGIGTSVIIDGTPLRGEHGQAGNLGGHFVQTLAPRACPCGNVGCAESEASGWSVQQLARQDGRYAESALADEPSADLAAIFRCAAAGDELALRLREHCIGVWSGLAVSLIHAYDPELLVFGGGVMDSSEQIIPAIADHVQKHAWTPWGKVRVAAAALGNDAALLGVGHLVQLHDGNVANDMSIAIDGQPRPHAKFARKSLSPDRLRSDN
jgi:glucokinase